MWDEKIAQTREGGGMFSGGRRSCKESGTHLEATGLVTAGGFPIQESIMVDGEGR